jgi:hypothetical protein
MVANKVPGVRAALCHDVSSARNSREHNHANVLTWEQASSGGSGPEIVRTGWARWGPAAMPRVQKITDVERATPAEGQGDTDPSTSERPVSDHGGGVAALGRGRRARATLRLMPAAVRVKVRRRRRRHRAREYHGPPRRAGGLARHQTTRSRPDASAAETTGCAPKPEHRRAVHQPHLVRRAATYAAQRRGRIGHRLPFGAGTARSRLPRRAIRDGARDDWSSTSGPSRAVLRPVREDIARVSTPAMSPARRW